MQSEFEAKTANHSPSLISKIAIGAIKIYRAHISSRKGYKCANGVMGHRTCSSQGLDYFRTLPLHDAFKELRVTLMQCRKMSNIFNIAVAHDEKTALDKIQSEFGIEKEKALEFIARAKAFDQQDVPKP